MKTFRKTTSYFLVLLAALALALLFCFLLTACSKQPIPSTGVLFPPQTTSAYSGPTNPTPSTSKTPTTIPVKDPRKTASQYVPAEVSNPDNLPVLKWVCLTDEWTRVWSEDAAIELNQMLADKNMPFRVQFIIMTYYTDDIYALLPSSPYFDWFSKPEAQEILREADLIYGAMTGQEMQEYLIPITENVTGSASPSLQNAVPHELNWLTQTVGGEIYGIPSGPSQGTTTGWWISPEFYAQMQLTETDLQRNFWEMDTLFADMYEKNGNQPFLYVQEGVISSIAEFDEKVLPQKLPSSIKWYARGSFQCIGSCFAIDNSGNSPTVVNLLESEAVRSYQQAIMRYKNAGYVTEDLDMVKIDYSRGLADFSYLTNDGSEQYYPLTDPVLNISKPGGYTIGVAASSQNPDAGKTLLALIAEDEAFRMQLLFGKEGRDYSTVDGEYKKTMQADGSSYSLRFLSPLSYFSGFVSSGVYAQEGKTELESFRETLDHSSVPYFIVFDFSGLENELAAVQAQIDRYFHYFTTTQKIPGNPSTEADDSVASMNEAGYDQMLQDFKDAGSDKIVAELQRQLDEWLAQNPGW